ISSRLDRLNCFDTLFATPVTQMLPRAIENNTPLSWQRAFNSLSEYQEGDVYHLTTEGEGEKTNAWITLLALNQTTHFPDNAKPVLLMSCIDNLSRVELALPSAIDDPRIQLSIANTEVQYWR
ncbi:type VI secretion system-associated protein TagO, partial [Streptomyces sp. P17]